MTRDKKNFAPVVHTHSDDLAKRWRVESWKPFHNGSSAKRVVKYGSINNVTSINEHYQLAFH